MAWRCDEELKSKAAVKNGRVLVNIVKKDFGLENEEAIVSRINWRI